VANGPLFYSLVHEHHGLAAVEDDAVIEVITDRAREHAALDVAALADEIFRRVAMADALDVLIDDRSLEDSIRRSSLPSVIVAKARA